MCAKTRKFTRYDVLGRVESEELSALPGTLIDISSQGCKLHYANPVAVNLENDYTINVKFTDAGCPKPLTLICHPVWVSEDSGSTDIGMTFLHSPDTDSLKEYIKYLHLDSQSTGSVEDQIVDEPCQFV